MNYIVKILLIFLFFICNIFNTFCYYNSSSLIKNDFNTEKYNFSIDYDGGTSSQTTIKVTNNKVTITSPSKNGYRFSRFSYEKDGNTFYTGSRNILINNINNQVLKANWNIVTYTIGYTLNGGTCSEEMITSYNVLSDPIVLCKPYKYGFTFKGWSGSNGNKAEETVVIPTGSYGNKVYAATYERNI